MKSLMLRLALVAFVLTHCVGCRELIEWEEENNDGYDTMLYVTNRSNSDVIVTGSGTKPVLDFRVPRGTTLSKAFRPAAASGSFAIIVSQATSGPSVFLGSKAYDSANAPRTIEATVSASSGVTLSP